jgi:hypothetical protein
MMRFYGGLAVDTDGRGHGYFSREFGPRGQSHGRLHFLRQYPDEAAAKRAVRGHLRRLRDDINLYLEDTK